ncbi:hypothetical protein OIU77_012762 [Salix suchowensis]|uniref:NADH-plastoquinone oxidoreductase subunit 5 n=1 Tax=Salix suchowensis TaxID=1278906 RepID=A0ABQ9A4V6_9ROSI|nr:hypothetical protein OIU77_012762 [Salix suchowensis]
MFLMLKKLLSHLNKNRSIMTVVVQSLFARSEFPKELGFQRKDSHEDLFFAVSGALMSGLTYIYDISHYSPFDNHGSEFSIS